MATEHQKGHSYTKLEQKKSKLVWNRKCPKCKKVAIPQVGYPSHFYCFKGGHGMFKILKIKGKTKAIFEYDRVKCGF